MVDISTDNWNESDLSDLLTELKLLIHIGQHKNVVSILGACTKGDFGPRYQHKPLSCDCACIKVDCMITFINANN